MQLFSDHFSEEYAKEAVNVGMMDLVLIKDPHRKIRNNLAEWRAFLVFCIIWTFVCLYFLNEYMSMVFVICFALMLISTVIVTFYVLWAGKGLADLKRPGRCVRWTFEKDVICFKLNDSYEIRFPWDSFQCLRICDHGIFFIPKERGKVTVVGIPAEYKEAVIGFLKENDLNIGLAYGNP